MSNKKKKEEDREKEEFRKEFEREQAEEAMERKATALYQEVMGEQALEGGTLLSTSGDLDAVDDLR